jgi:hypothetical protein
VLALYAQPLSRPSELFRAAKIFGAQIYELPPAQIDLTSTTPSPSITHSSSLLIPHLLIASLPSLFVPFLPHTTHTMASATTSAAAAKVDALIQKTPEKLSGLALYSRFALAGAICCSVTHGALTPVDV